MYLGHTLIYRLIVKIVRHPFTKNMRKKTNIFVNIVHFIYQWRVSIESLIDSGTWSPTD
jgi:hypothetical protein